MKRKILTLILISTFSFNLIAQEFYKQTIRGTIIDKSSQFPLVGANVVLLETDPVIGAISDNKGEFRIENVPIGRYSVQVSYLGFTTIIKNNLLLSSGKDLVLSFELEENVITTGEVVIKAFTRKDQPVNKMATVSARSFTMEETKRYAGSLGDPARMAANYAGVISVSDKRNDIIIRGNSSMGLLWRLDGFEIPNPNHFGASGTTGGPITILNHNLLTNSDFLTGAFPAEYGNSTSGVFDLKMRTGNNEKREYWAQIGWNGFEIGAEGPFSKKARASYLINYRFSVTAVLDAIGIDVGLLPSKYQDLTFKVNIPTGKFGKLNIIGIGGLSSVDIFDSKKEPEDWTFKNSGEDLTSGSNLGLLGLSHLYFFNTKTRLMTNLSVLGSVVSNNLDTFSVNTEPFKKLREESSEVKYSISTHLNNKFNAKNSFSTGAYVDIYKMNYVDSIYLQSHYRIKTNTKEKMSLLQGYAQWRHKITNAFSTYTGIHYQFLTLNNSQSLEPRLGIKWNFKKNQSINLGFGIHSQMQPRVMYFVQSQLLDSTFIKTNENLDFSRSNQAVVGYDYLINENLRIKLEVYYQLLNNIPVLESKPVYSLINFGADFYIPREDSLINKGTGKNYGVEVTFERFFYKSYYFLITTSLFESKYSGYDKIERNTAFNLNYVINVLGGYEFKVGKHHLMSLGLKGTYTGGKPYLPFDINNTLSHGEQSYDWDNAYINRYDNYIRLDLKIEFKRNKKRLNIEYALDLQNITNHKNVFVERISLADGEIQKIYQLGFYPIVTWRIQF